MSLVQGQEWTAIIGRKQQIIAVQLFFEESEAPSISELRQIADTIGKKFERMRGIPWDINKNSRIFKDVDDWQAALDIIVQDVPLEDDTKENARLFLEDVKLQDIDTVENDIEVPLWRCYRVGNRSIILTIDHVIGDGLSLASILAVVSTVSEGGRTLHLDEVSPLLSVICKSSFFQRFYHRWAIKFLSVLILGIFFTKQVTRLNQMPLQVGLLMAAKHVPMHLHSHASNDYFVRANYTFDAFWDRGIY